MDGTVPMDRIQHALDALPQHENSPYLNARTEFMERYGELVTGRENWRRTAFTSLGIAGVAVAGLVALALQSRVVPYVVEVDRLGRVIAVGRADQAAGADAKVIRAELADWILNARSVYVDAAALRAANNRAYSRVAENSPAYHMLNNYFRENNPFERAREETVTVDVQSVLPLGGDTWRVEWSETVRARNGMATTDKPVQWQAAITVKIAPPMDEQAILKNPFGVLIPELSWTQRQ